MRLKACLFFPAFVFCCLSPGICQDRQIDNVHEGLKKKKTAKEIILPSSLSIGQLFASLEKAASVQEKAEILFRISRYYGNALKIDSGLYFSEKLKELSTRENYEPGLGKYHLARANALYFRRKSKEAMESLDQALLIFSRHKNLLYLGLGYQQLAKQLDQLDDFKSSRIYYHKAIPLLIAAGEQREVQRAWYELGRNFYQTYEVDSSVYYLLISLRLAEEQKEPVKVFNSSSLLGIIYLSSGNMENAGKYLEYALEVRTPATSKIQVRNLWGNCAEYYIAKGDFENAKTALREHEQLNNLLGDTWGVIIAKKLKGEFFYQSGNYPEALKNLREAYNRRAEIQAFAFDIKNIAYQLGKTEIKTGDYDNAILHLRHARQLSRELQFLLDEMESNLLLAEAFQLKQNTDSAYYYFRTYSSLKDSMLSLQKEKAVMELTVKYEAEKKEQQILQLQNEKKLSDYQLQLKVDEIEKQTLLDIRKTQQLALLSQQNEINRLQASEKSLALQYQEKETAKKQNELVLMGKEKELQSELAARQRQQKKIAYSAGAIILLMGGYAFYRARQHKKLGKQLAASLAELKLAQKQLIKSEKEKEAENIRVRISRDIHDEVGATLSGVALFSEIAKQKIQQDRQQEAEEYLEHISANSKEMVEKMSDIVWTINPQNDSFDRIISKLQSFTVNLCAGKGMQLHLDIDDRVRTYYPSMQVRRNIYLIIKEAINNAVKYSGGKNIFFSIHRENDVIEAVIQDDGQGFDKNRTINGNGLNNMQARAAELNGKLDIDSVPGKGTVVRLAFNFHPAGGHPEVV